MDRVKNGEWGDSYQAQSIEIPRRRKIEYSSHEKACSEEGLGWSSSELD